MTIREIIKAIIKIFLPALGSAFLGIILTSIFLGIPALPIHNLVAVAVFATGGTLALGIFYSKDRLTKGQIIVRYILHFIFVLVVAVALMFFTWPSFQWIYLTAIVPLCIVGYFAVFIYDEVHSRRLSNKLTDGIKKYQKDVRGDN